MSIGLYDLDMANYCPVPFNLELMKLSSYYKKKREIVNLSPSFSPEMYTSFIIRKDYYDGIFPKEIYDYNNVTYGGYAFSNNKYIPLDLNIESQKPDTSIYEKIQKTFCVDNKTKALFNVMLRAQHLRLSLDGTTIWDNFDKQLNPNINPATLFLHDFNLQNIKDADLVINDIIQSKKRKGPIWLAMKFPVIVTNSRDLEKWCKFDSSGQFFSLRYENIFNDEELVNLLRQGIINDNLKKIEYVITKSSKDENDFIENKLLKIYHQIMFFRMFKIRISLKYEDNFFIHKEWERLIQFFNCFINSTTSLDQKRFDYFINEDSLYSFACSIKKDGYGLYKRDIFHKDEVRNLFNLVREKNYEVFKEFYDCHLVKLKGGVLVNDTNRN